MLENIDFHECKLKFWNHPLYCKPIRNLTPAKSKTGQPEVQSISSQAIGNPVSVKSPTPQLNSSKPEARNTIPGMPESELVKARKKRMKLQNKNQSSPSHNDFEFSDVEDLNSSRKNVICDSDSSKRKVVSPVQSDILRKSKSIKN